MEKVYLPVLRAGKDIFLWDDDSKRGWRADAREQRSAARSALRCGLRTAVALSGLSSSSVLRTLKLVRGKTAVA